jgi:predicted nucleic acid-binding protein
VIVLDASAAVVVLLNLPPSAVHIQARLVQPGESLHAPHILDLEVLQTLRHYAVRGLVPQEQLRGAITNLASMPLTRYSHVPFLDRIWELRANVAAYDAVYIALAEALGATLLTRDGRLAKAPGLRADVELYP